MSSTAILFKKDFLKLNFQDYLVQKLGPTPIFLNPALSKMEQLIFNFFSTPLLQEVLPCCQLIIFPPGSSGHCLLVNGLTWDPVTQQGSLYFVDPLDPSQNYSPTVPLGSAKQTIGTLVMDSNGDLILTYRQYIGRLPYDSTAYSEAVAKLGGVLSVGASPFTPFTTLLPTGNNHAIAVGFDSLNLATSSMFPILAVLNTLVDPVDSAFDQMDPSPFNAILYSEQDAAALVQNVIDDNFLLYRRCCSSLNPCECPFRIWLSPFAQGLHQHGESDSMALSGYKNPCYGGVLGGEYVLNENIIMGMAGAILIAS